jgi:allantoinase
MAADLVLRGGTVVTDVGLFSADVAIEDGIIIAVDLDLPGGREEIDARDLAIFPGLIDVHLHFNEPGRTEWEGAATGSRALAAGGGTVFFDMPLNSTPCTVNAHEFDKKHAALSRASITDFGLWGGLVPGGVSNMEELAARGVVGFKAFLCDSGLPEFPRADDLTLYEGLREAGRLGLCVAVHAESHEITQGLARRAAAKENKSIRDFLESRPILAEVEAIHRAAFLARAADAPLYIVHVSSGAGVAAALEERARGTQVTIETCPHYLYFTEEDVERLGAIAKCAPPLRREMDRDQLWGEVLRGTVSIVASDHSPAPPEMKTGDFWGAWGGIAGVQSTLNVLLEEGYHKRDLPLQHIAALVSSVPAERFRLTGRGSVLPGNHADLTLVADLETPRTLEVQDLHQRHRLSPYVGRTFRGSVQRTIRRGQTIYENGRITAKTNGTLVKPSAS